MIGRTPDEWIGKDADTPFPPRVRVRQFERDGGCCCSCGVKIRAGMAWQTDHIVALAIGGENREANAQTLCGPCHSVKSKADVAEKATTYRKRSKHLGASKPKMGFATNRAGKFKRCMDGRVVAREK